MGSAVFFDGLVCISVAAVTAAGGSALTAGHFWRAPKVTKSALPHHSVPRLGSACLNEGIAPWAAAKGHPWPSAANGAPRSTSTARRPNSRPGSPGRTPIRSVGAKLARESGVPVNEDLGCAGPFASRLAPTGFRRRRRAKGPLMQMIGPFECVYECFSITHGIMHAVMNSK